MSDDRERIASIDQFRGFTVVAMLVVNGSGGFDAVPAILKHHRTYCSYADTIMPQFFLAVGLAYRLTFCRRLERFGPREAYLHALSRIAALLVLGLLVHGLDGGSKTWEGLKAIGPVGVLQNAFTRNYFQTLVHIAMTSLWILPVIAKGQAWRWGWMIFSAAVHVLISRSWYLEWVMKRPGIDGGILGFLTWSIPMLTGSLAIDWMRTSTPFRVAAKLVSIATVMMTAGYMLTAGDGRLDPPPFFPPDGPVNLWTMSQRTGSVSYQTFAAGFSLAVYAVFVIICDAGGFGLGMFRTFGRNALAAYLIGPLAEAALNPFLPHDAPGWYVALGTALGLAISYLVVRHLERQSIFLKL